MPGQILWQSGAIINFFPQLSGQGISLANGSRIQLSGDIYNNGVSGGPSFFGLCELTCSASGFGAAVQAGQTVDLYLLPAQDGTNPITGATSGLPSTAFVGSFVTPVSGNVGRLAMAVQQIPLLPVRYQSWLVNNTGQTLTSGYSVYFGGYQQAYT